MMRYTFPEEIDERRHLLCSNLLGGELCDQRIFVYKSADGSTYYLVICVISAMNLISCGNISDRNFSSPKHRRRLLIASLEKDPATSNLEFQ